LNKKGVVQFGRPQTQTALVTYLFSIADNGGANWALEGNIQGHYWLCGEFTLGNSTLPCGGRHGG
ncbi:MAG: hypothetical protein KJO42_02970, partial [Silicimonas sp.]|nr:hypothetical protein [Silicimonas sp.]